MVTCPHPPLSLPPLPLFESTTVNRSFHASSPRLLITLFLHYLLYSIFSLPSFSPFLLSLSSSILSYSISSFPIPILIYLPPSLSTHVFHLPISSLAFFLPLSPFCLPITYFHFLLFPISTCLISFLSLYHFLYKRFPFHYRHFASSYHLFLLSPTLPYFSSISTCLIYFLFFSLPSSPP